MEIVCYTQVPGQRYIARHDEASHDLVKQSAEIMGHTYSELEHEGRLFVFLTPSPIDREVQEKIIGEIAADVMLLRQPGDGMWL